MSTRTTHFLPTFVLIAVLAGCATQQPPATVAAPHPETQAVPAASGTELSDVPLDQLEKRVGEGDIKAMVEMGSRYGTGKGVPQNFDRALEYLRSAANKNDPDAEFFIGTAYSNGTGVERNETMAIFWYEKAADQGHAPAEYWLAIRIINGMGGIAPSWPAAIPYLMDSAAKGYPQAEFMLGYAYQMGKGVDPNPRAAAYWYRRTDSRQHNLKAQANLLMLIQAGLVAREPGDPGAGKPQANAPADAAQPAAREGDVQ